MTQDKKIELRGVSTHNLKAIDLDIPQNRFVVVSGPSGAGKSSLVFDTIFAEAQRRYIETFSPYARQFLERLPRPDALFIGDLPPAISITQTNPVKSARSTLATLAEITHPAKLLFYRKAKLICSGCGQPVAEQGPQDVLELLNRVKDRLGKGLAIITARVKGTFLKEYIRLGYFRILHGDTVVDVSMDPSRYSTEDVLELVVDRFDLSSLDTERVVDSVEQAFLMGNGFVQLHIPGKESIPFSKGFHCARCDINFSHPHPNFFSFNSPAGACPECQGFGRIVSIDWDLVVPDKSLSILEGAIRPLENWEADKEELLEWCSKESVDPGVPWEELPDTVRHRILFGHGSWHGIKACFDYLEKKRYKAHVRILLSKYRAYLTCPVCKGSRFRPEVSLYRLDGLTLPDFYSMSIEQAFSWIEQFSKGKSLDVASAHLVEELHQKLSTLNKAGLGYLGLDRQSRTLSGGEVGRIFLARALSTRLSQTLYVLDEPTLGLHPVDVSRIISLLRELRDNGNSVIAVENDPQVVEEADMVVGLGPGSGDQGGRIEYVTPGYRFKKNIRSFGEHREETKRLSSSVDYLIVRGVRENNLKDITVRLPVGRITSITGVSGSGKSTLLELVLHRGILRQKGLPVEPPGKFEAMEGIHLVGDVHFLGQAPLGRNSRACPASYLKVFDTVRKLFSETEDARIQGLKPGDFSFNTRGGRCEVCKGQGSEIVEMQFLPDVVLPCPVCRGKRFTEHVLRVRYRGKNIADVLDMTISRAADFFGDIPKIIRILNQAVEMGLGYLRLGQPLSTLSLGEAQRLRLVHHLFQKGKRHDIFLLDEPTRGLHPREVEHLIKGMEKLAEEGNTLVLVEHNCQVIEASHWVVDLGPEGGHRGGYLVYEGPVSGLMSCKESKTGSILRTMAGAEVSESEYTKAKIEKETEGEKLPICDVIEIKGARHHNLKDVTVTIPKGKLVTITGVSGSGKSSLAFDIIFAEGQRRYMESLPSYMRQFVRMYEQPDVDEVRGLTPTVSIEQRTSRGGTMSTVATLTEVAHYARLLYSKTASAVCPSCGQPLEAMKREAILKRLSDEWEGKEIIIFAPRIRSRKGFHLPVFEGAIREGITHVLVDGEVISIPPIPSLSRYQEHTIGWGFGPVRVEKGKKELEIMLERALFAGEGEVNVWSLAEGRNVARFSEFYSCYRCGISLSEPDPLLFSFHTSSGRCPTCQGRGCDETGKGICMDCGGTRLNTHARAWKIDGMGIDEFFDLEVEDAFEVVQKWEKESPWDSRLDQVTERLCKSMHEKLAFLLETGLGYLPLSRSGDSLSGGEAQRIRLAAQIGSGLTGLTIVLDEPTIGLHPRDNRRLIEVLKKLRNRGNSVIVVEHDEDTLMASDLIIDLGPGGGKKGGMLVAQGSPGEIMKNSGSVTGQALLDHRRHVLRSKRRRPDGRFVSCKGIRRRNIKEMDISFPLGAFVCLVGVSGSGKSTLLSEVLVPGIEQCLRKKGDESNDFEWSHASSPLGTSLDSDASSDYGVRFYCKELTGVEPVDRVVVVDHSPIGRTPRSCPATYIGLFGEIRKLMAQRPGARARGYDPSRFSFNVQGGRCEACKGQGSQKVSLGILPDVYVVCEECGGTRFDESTLEIEWKGMNISQILNLTFDEAKDIFSAVPSVLRPISVVCSLGLGYLTLGQPSPTLSGGEAQRIKLARELVNPSGRKTIYFLDEPTTGLHMKDIELLVDHLQMLIDKGNSVVVIEHNLDVIACADWIIELGPGGGKYGGNLLYSGYIDEFTRCATGTPTGRALTEYLDK